MWSFFTFFSLQSINLEGELCASSAGPQGFLQDFFEFDGSLPKCLVLSILEEGPLVLITIV